MLLNIVFLLKHSFVFAVLPESQQELKRRKQILKDSQKRVWTRLIEGAFPTLKVVASKRKATPEQVVEMEAEEKKRIAKNKVGLKKLRKDAGLPPRASLEEEAVIPADGAPLAPVGPGPQIYASLGGETSLTPFFGGLMAPAPAPPLLRTQSEFY